MSELLTALIAPLLVGLAPVPADRPPDPLGWGYLGIAPDVGGGLVLTTVEPGSAAARAGLLVGDELVRVGTLRPRAFEDVIAHVGGFRPGTELRVEVRRNGTMKVVTARLGTRPPHLGPPRAGGAFPIPRDD